MGDADPNKGSSDPRIGGQRARYRGHGEASSTSARENDASASIGPTARRGLLVDQVMRGDGVLRFGTAARTMQKGRPAEPAAPWYPCPADTRP